MAAVALSACPPGNQEARRRRSACGAGDASACNQFAVKLRKGGYVLRDEQRAAGLFDQACTSAIADACTNFAVMLQRGAGVPKDSARAVNLLRQGCDGAAMEGCARLGVLYVQGAVVTRDVGRAAALFQQSCDHGQMMGCAHLGSLYETGEGLARNYDRAAELFQKSCDHKVAIGCVGLGRLHAAGTGSRSDHCRGAVQNGVRRRRGPRLLSFGDHGRRRTWREPEFQSWPTCIASHAKVAMAKPARAAGFEGRDWDAVESQSCDEFAPPRLRAWICRRLREAATMTGEPLLAVEHLTKQYKNVLALDDVSYDHRRQPPASSAKTAQGRARRSRFCSGCCSRPPVARVSADRVRQWRSYACGLACPNTIACWLR